MSYNIVKTINDPKTGKKSVLFILDGLSSVLEIKELDKALNMADIFNQNSDSGWVYEVKQAGKTINKN